MRNMKRWLAFMLIITMVLGDGGVISAFATEVGTTSETSVSDNNGGNADEFILENEIIKDHEDLSTDQTGNTDDTETGFVQDETEDSELKTELPALHIGQIKKGEELPDADDSEFKYDLPVSFEMSDCLTLFVNYNIMTMPENEENGTLVWSILRGEKGMTAGSTNLVGEEDDWTGFEVVSDSPYFTVKEIEEEESGHYKMIELASKDSVDHGSHDYYIRAAYYWGTGKHQDEAFYAAVTIPFLPQNDDADIDNAQDDTTDEEDDQTDIIPDDISDDMSVTEDTDHAGQEESESLDNESADTTPVAGEDDIELILEESVSDNSADITVMEDSTISENDVPEPHTKESIGVLTLSAESVTLHPGDTFSVSATIVPKDPSASISWNSSDDAVATVDENGKITAIAEGVARITAECGDMTAAVRVEVVAKDADEVYDISGDIWVDGFQKESDALVYTGQKITQNFRVYHKETLLKEKTDYTLSYKNNVNAAAYNAAKAPSVTITMKGHYQGSVTLYYTIKPADIKVADIYNTKKDNADETGADAAGYKQAVNYSKNLKIPNPELTFSKKKLAANKDYVCDYTILQEELQQKDYKKGDSYEPGKVYHYTVNGVGNFTGSIPMQLVILKDKNLNFNSASVTLSQNQYEYDGTDLIKSVVAIKQLKINRQILDPDLKLYDYDVYATGIEGAYIMVYPTAAGEKEGYFGFKKVALKLVGDRKISEASEGVNWKDNLPFSQKTVNEEGGIFQAGTGVLTFGTEKEMLTEGRDYTVKYSNAKKVGTVTVTFTGMGRYKGTLKKKYKIVPDIAKNNFTIRWKNVTREADELLIAYQKGGASPDFVLMDQDNNVLKNKTDYTVKLKDNKTPGMIMSCEITGKGNYKGYTEIVQLKVKHGDISKAVISIPDKPYSTKQNAWKSTVTIKDVNGKKLSAGTDYDKQIAYTYENMEQPPAAGSTVTVTVKGTGCYEGSTISGSYRIFENNISKLQIVIDNQEYTGKEVTLLSKDIHVYASAADKKNKNELPNAESCYQIVEYNNNIKVGTAKVTLRGIGSYGGTKTYSFKIQKKKYLINRAEKVILNPTSFSMFFAERRTLTAELTPNMPEDELDNPTIIWSSSNSNIATVETVEINTVPGGATVTGAITVKKAGTVTITATAQDGGKKAQCKVTIVDGPILTEAGQTIEMEMKEDADQTYQLKLEWAEFQEQKTDGLIWESSNSEVVSVDKNGLLTIKRNKVGTVVIKLYSSNRKYVQQCYVVVKGEEEIPEGKHFTYTQKPGTTDDTDAINKILRDWEWNPNADDYDYLYIPAGVYRIDTVSDPNREGFFGGIVLTDNQTLIMSPNALLIAIPNSSTDSHVIYAFGRNNITISGGQIVGERNEHTGKGGEWGHGIDISGCTDVHISDVDISQCWGDGIYLGFYDGPDICSDGVTIENCNLHHNRRSNLSITDVSNVTIRNCRFSYASGTDPQYGIDIEPNDNRPCKNIKIYDSTFTGNAKASMGIITPASDIRLENCTLDGNFYNMAGKNVVLKNTTIKGEIVDKTGIKYEK